MPEAGQMDSLVLVAPGVLRIERRPIPEPGPGEVRIRVLHAGICGSDIHYFRQGGYGSVRMSAPMVLGHEIAGRIDRLGPGISESEFAPGTQVAVDPSAPCGICEPCKQGQSRFCTAMRFMGSALRHPATEGGFSEYLVCAATRAVALTGNACTRLGADRVIDLRSERPVAWSHDAGLECAGHPDAFRTMVAALAPGGHLVELGLMGDEISFPVNEIVLRELRIEGSFRFDTEFREAVRLISQGVVDVAPLITRTFCHRDAVPAMQAAQDRGQAIKVLLSF